MEDGKLRKTSAANLYEGTAETRTVDNLRGLAAIIDGLTSEEALTFGVCGFDKARVATQKRAPSRKDLRVVCRDRAHFHWPEGRGRPDVRHRQAPQNGSAPLKAMEFDALLCELQPWWMGVARMYRPSASAFICDASGGDLTGASSLRCYSIVDIAKNAHFVGINVADAFWRAGDMGELSSRRPAACWCVVPSTRQSGSLSGSTLPVLSFLARGSPRRKSPPLFLEGGDVDSEQVLDDGIGEVSFSEWSRGSIDVRRANRLYKPEEKRRKAIVIDDKSKG